MKNELEKLLWIIKENRNLVINLYLITREKENSDLTYKIFDTAINYDIKNDFLQIFVSVLEEISNIDDIDFIKYNPCYYSDKNEIEYIESANVPNFSKITRSIIESNLSHIVRIDDELLRYLWAYCIRIESVDNNIFYFRKYNKSKVITKKGLFGLFYKDGYFNKIIQDLFLFDNKIDAFYYNNNIFILNKTYFEQIFNYMDEYKNNAITFLEEIKNLNIIDINDDFINWCLADPKKIKKLIDISNNEYYRDLTFEDIRNAKQEFELAFSLDEINEKINFKNKRDIWEVLKVLNDDYLNSKFTNNKYEVKSKSKK